MQRHSIPSAWSAFVAAFALMMGGCGGGGSGGTPPEPPLSSSVQLNNTTYSSTKFSVFESASRLPGVSITADVVGDVSKLNGKLIYVIVVDPDGLFEAGPTLQLGANGKGNRLELIGKPTRGHAGAYRGTLQVNVCVDAVCKEPLGNSPLQIPYDITIASGATLAAGSPLVVETTFGEPASLPASFTPALTREVAVTLPADTSRVNVSTPPMAGVDSPFWGLGLSNGKLQIAFYDAPPGTYDGVIRIETDGQLGGVMQSSSSDLAVRYVVRANPAVNMLFRPVPEEFRANLHEQSFKLVAADGKRYSSVSRIVYGPGGTNANGNKWLQLTPAGNATGGVVMTARSVYCTGGGFANCLQEGGLYEASVYFKTADGIEFPTPLPIKLRAN